MTQRTYRMPAFWRWQILVMHALFAVVAFVLLVVAVSGVRGGPPVLFSLAWVTIFIWNGYWFVFRIATEVTLTDAELRWHTPVGSGSLPLASLREVKPFAIGWAFYSFKPVSGRSVLLWARKGIVPFLEQVQAQAPQAEVRISRMTRLAERLPGRRSLWDD